MYRCRVTCSSVGWRVCAAVCSHGPQRQSGWTLPCGLGQCWEEGWRSKWSALWTETGPGPGALASSCDRHSSQTDKGHGSEVSRSEEGQDCLEADRARPAGCRAWPGTQASCPISYFVWKSPFRCKRLSKATARPRVGRTGEPETEWPAYSAWRQGARWVQAGALFWEPGGCFYSLGPWPRPLPQRLWPGLAPTSLSFNYKL